MYRLITRGTIEEKIYQRQVYKLILSKRILENANQKALFSANQLHELFVLTDDAKVSSGAGVQTARRRRFGSSESDSDSETDEYRGRGRRVFHEDANANGGDSDEASEEGQYEEVAYRPAHPPSGSEGPSRRGDQDGEGDSDGKAKSRDKRVLQALLNGAALAGVYDHERMDPNSVNRPTRDFSVRYR